MRELGSRDADSPAAEEKNPNGDAKNSLVDEINAKEIRKLRTQSQRDRTVWTGVSAFGVVGWSIAVPTLIGVFVGMWLDKNWPSKFSWTLALLMAGLSIGCMMAWNWVQKERSHIDSD